MRDSYRDGGGFGDAAALRTSTGLSCSASMRGCAKVMIGARSAGRKYMYFMATENDVRTLD